MTVDETAAFLSVSRRQVYRLLDTGELPAVRVGARIRIDPAELRASLPAIDPLETREPGFDRAQGSRDDNDAESSAPAKRV
jgi:excisionase family DNA binding protein